VELELALDLIQVAALRFRRRGTVPPPPSERMDPFCEVRHHSFVSIRPLRRRKSTRIFTTPADLSWNGYTVLPWLISLWLA